jgi:hypothetical protein
LISCSFAQKGEALPSLIVSKVSDSKSPRLVSSRKFARLASEKITALNQSGAGPLFFLSELLPEISEEDRGRLAHDIQRLPDLIGVFGDLLSIYRPFEVVNTGANTVLRNCELVFFYMLLDRFNFGFPTLSCLLRAMRQARSVAFPSAKYLRNIAASKVTLSERSKPEGRSDMRDPLRESALQRRLNRLFRDNGNWHFQMQFWVSRYLSDEFSQQRASGAILFSVLKQLAAPHHPPPA